MSHDPLVQMAFLTRQAKVWFSLPFKPFVHNLSQKRPIKCLFYLPWDSFQPVSPNQPYLDCIGPYWGGELDPPSYSPSFRAKRDLFFVQTVSRQCTIQKDVFMAIFISQKCYNQHNVRRKKERLQSNTSVP